MHVLHVPTYGLLACYFYLIKSGACRLTLINCKVDTAHGLSTVWAALYRDSNLALLSNEGCVKF